ncbi:MAG: hypothetical protein MJE66_11190 [Proteobacteria bacterium]|nr:hypothetical protein [Pseudomonadota bacterium]
MPRDLGDVLHYFLPEAVPAEEEPAPRSPARPPAALPLLSLPIGDRDVVRAAFAWNLVVEVARLGGRAVLVAPGDDESLWPDGGETPLGAEIVRTPCGELSDLYHAALDVAVSRAPEASEGGVVFVRIPPCWLRKAVDGGRLLEWVLLFSSPDPRDLLETYGIAKLLMAANPSSRVGVTIHGVRRHGDAHAAFARIARTSQQFLGHPLVSYGLLVDDLHVYRAIVARRPVGLAHPQAPAAKALQDVARMVFEDAQERALG